MKKNLKRTIWLALGLVLLLAGGAFADRVVYRANVRISKRTFTFADVTKNGATVPFFNRVLEGVVGDTLVVFPAAVNPNTAPTDTINYRGTYFSVLCLKKRAEIQVFGPYWSRAGGKKSVAADSVCIGWTENGVPWDSLHIIPLEPLIPSGENGRYWVEGQ